MSGILPVNSPLTGFIKVTSLPAAFATMSVFWSGVIIRWWGSLPTGTVFMTLRVGMSIKLTVASPEFKTIAILGSALESAAIAGWENTALNCPVKANMTKTEEVPNRALLINVRITSL